MDLSIDNVEPMFNQRVTPIPIKITIVTAGQWNRYWNLLALSRDGTINTWSTETIRRISSNLLDTTQSLNK